MTSLFVNRFSVQINTKFNEKFKGKLNLEP